MGLLDWIVTIFSIFDSPSLHTLFFCSAISKYIAGIVTFQHTIPKTNNILHYHSYQTLNINNISIMFSNGSYSDFSVVQKMFYTLFFPNQDKAWVHTLYVFNLFSDLCLEQFCHLFCSHDTDFFKKKFWIVVLSHILELSESFFMVYV